MANVSSRTRFKSLQQVFAYGRSELLTCLAQMAVLYEDLRIETFALTADDTEVKRLDYLDKRYRIHYFLRRSMVTLLEFRGAPLRISKTAEFKAERATALRPGAPDNKKRNRDSFQIIAANAVGGHFTDAAAATATENIESNASGKLEITFDASGRDGGAKLYFAGEIAATAFIGKLPGVKPRDEEVPEAIKMVRDSYAHATRSMHALIILFLWDRFA